MEVVIGTSWPPVLASFLASLVEVAEALAVVLAIGSVRGWRSALMGAALAFLALLGLVLISGFALARVPPDVVQLVVGGLLLLFGLRWLRTAILRAARVIALHDENAAFRRETQKMQWRERSSNRLFDAIAVAAVFQGVMREGAEIGFVVIAVGAAGGILVPAGLAAIGAMIVIVLLGLAVSRPAAWAPENTIKLIVGAMLSGLGTFWAGTGIGAVWLGDEGAVFALIVGYVVLAIVLIVLARSRRLA